MSKDLQAILALAIAPFLVFHGWQICIGSAAILMGGEALEFVIFPSHLAWFFAGIVLVIIKLFAMTCDVIFESIHDWITDDTQYNEAKNLVASREIT